MRRRWQPRCRRRWRPRWPARRPSGPGRRGRGAGPDAGPQTHPADAGAGAGHPAGPDVEPDAGPDAGPPATATARREHGVAPVTPLHPADADRAGARRRAAAVDELFAAAPAARDGAPGGFARPAGYPPQERPAGYPPQERPAGYPPPAAGPAAPERNPGHPAPAPHGRVGVADGLFAAVLAARAGVLVPAGRTAEFLAPYPVAALGDEVLAELLDRLGLSTVGAFAALPAEAVADRFGLTGTVAHRLARGLQPRPLVPRAEGPDLSVEQRFDPPEPLAEPLVFVARTLAEQLHRRLAGAGLTCQRVAVEVSCADGRTVSRLWRHEGRLSATALAERVRWQLQAWQGAGTFDAPAGAEDEHGADPAPTARASPPCASSPTTSPRPGAAAGALGAGGRGRPGGARGGPGPGGARPRRAAPDRAGRRAGPGRAGRPGAVGRAVRPGGPGRRALAGPAPGRLAGRGAPHPGAGRRAGRAGAPGGGGRPGGGVGPAGPGRAARAGAGGGGLDRALAGGRVLVGPGARPPPGALPGHGGGRPGAAAHGGGR
ncbi:hypothetical protein ACFQ0M_14135 [Kitasatospora aburaviensis]